MAKNCGNKISNTCGARKNSACIDFEGTPNSQSELVEETCLDQEQVTQDLYNQVGEIKTEIDLSDLGELCLSYTLEEGKVIVKNVLAKFEEVICDLQERIVELETEPICSKPIGECIDVIGCLVDPCDNSILTLGDWMKTVAEKICINNG